MQVRPSVMAVCPPSTGTYRAMVCDRGSELLKARELEKKYEDIRWDGKKEEDENKTVRNGATERVQRIFSYRSLVLALHH